MAAQNLNGAPPAKAPARPQGAPRAPPAQQEDDGGDVADWSATPAAVQTLLLGTFVGSMNIVLLLLLFTCYRLWAFGPLDPLGLALALAQLCLGALPTRYTQGRHMRGFVRMVCAKCAEYFPVEVIVEGEAWSGGARRRAAKLEACASEKGTNGVSGGP